MASPRFFVDQPLSAGAAGSTVRLPEDVARHALRALRLPLGASIRLFDGRGGEYRATLDGVDRHGASARIDAFDPVEREWAGAPTLVLAVLASDPMDVAVRKAVELGVSAIVPVAAARSQAAPRGVREARRLLHWRSIAIAACEQCGRNRIPPIDEPRPLDEWLRSDASRGGEGVIAGPGASCSLASFAARTPPRFVVIGPEGGFTDAEMSLAIARGLTAVHLGARVLRADTAAVAALAMLAALAGDAR